MEFIHAGLAASSEENADRFYVDILDLEKSIPKVLDKKLSGEIFGINKELLIMHYRGGGADFEVLVYPEFKAREKEITHSCIKVEGFRNFINKCKDAGVKVIEAEKDSKAVTFICDYDGNLFEVKE